MPQPPARGDRRMPATLETRARSARRIVCRRHRPHAITTAPAGDHWATTWSEGRWRPHVSQSIGSVFLSVWRSDAPGWAPSSRSRASGGGPSRRTRTSETYSAARDSSRAERVVPRVINHAPRASGDMAIARAAAMTMSESSEAIDELLGGCCRWASGGPTIARSCERRVTCRLGLTPRTWTAALMARVGHG